MTLTQLQRNLYKELKPLANPEQFNKGYSELLTKVGKEQAKFYDRQFVFSQGYIQGTPQALDINQRIALIKKAGYKQATADRTCLAFDKVAKKIFFEIF